MFSLNKNPDQVMAMFNLEMMVPTLGKYILHGFEKSSMGAILQKNLEGSAFKFYPDPYPEQLFYRSDNATLARLGSAHDFDFKMNPIIIKPATK
jgi:hypothetical protein